MSAVSIHIKIMETKRVFTINVLLSDKIEAVKENIKDQEGFPIDSQRLMLNGTQMEEGRTLSSYSIRGEERLSLFFRK